MAGTINSWGNQIAAANSQIILNAGTNGVAISTDASAATVSVSTGAAVKTLQLGSTNSTSSFVLQAGSGASTITTANATLGVTTGTGAISISDDATATTCKFGTGAGAKLVTVGSTNGASSLALKTGTADFTLASATGTIMSALDTGEVTFPLQSAFLGTLGSTVTNVTGTGTVFTLGTTTALTVVFDQNSDFNSNGTYTAPVTARVYLGAGVIVLGCTISTGGTLSIVTSNRTYQTSLGRAAGNQNFGLVIEAIADMDSADTATVTISSAGEAADTDDIFGSATPGTFISGYIAC